MTDPPHLLGSSLPRGFDAAHGGLDGVRLVGDAAADVSDGGRRRCIELHGLRIARLDRIDRIADLLSERGDGRVHGVTWSRKAQQPKKNLGSKAWIQGSTGRNCILFCANLCSTFGMELTYS